MLHRVSLFRSISNVEFVRHCTSYYYRVVYKINHNIQRYLISFNIADITFMSEVAYHQDPPYSEPVFIFFCSYSLALALYLCYWSLNKGSACVRSGEQ